MLLLNREMCFGHEITALVKLDETRFITGKSKESFQMEIVQVFCRSGRTYIDYILRASGQYVLNLTPTHGHQSCHY